MATMVVTELLNLMFPLHHKKMGTIAPALKI